ncbi:hypothetical protein [Borreliella valaisiana]|uniref:hypothetical protein n=1 Tax=Borreliella valaisiana TaxID=62088 RepID=UPI002ED3DC06|nr:hypothetical protein KJD09_05010 [Borreliella valaisiana]
MKKLSFVQESTIEFKNNEEFNLINKMFIYFNILSEEYIDFRFGLHLTKNKALLKEYNN